jgi:hypothetical protein
MKLDNSYKGLKRAFYNMRVRQAELHGRELDDIDMYAGQLVCDIALKAMEDVRSEDRRPSLRAVSLATGLGKSTAAWAFLAAAADCQPDFSALYVVPTARLAEEAQAGIEALLGENTVSLWTSYHDEDRTDEWKSEALEQMGRVPERLMKREDTLGARILIVSHNAWKRSCQKGGTVKRPDVRLYDSQRRDIIFIDEHPDLADITSVKAEDMGLLYDALNAPDYQVDQALLKFVREAMTEMSAFDTKQAGQRFLKAVLVDDFELTMFDDINYFELAGEHKSMVKRQAHARRLQMVVDFLRAAAMGCCFYSKRERAFFAYTLTFDAGRGNVLLDATADISGLLPMHADVDVTGDLPQVSFENLETVLVPMPKPFKTWSRLKRSNRLCRDFGKFAREVVLRHTKEGDDVLILTRKHLVEFGHIDAPRNADEHADWEGRRVNAIWFGACLGENVYKHKTVVVSFLDFHLPRHKTISDTHAYSGDELTNDTLKQAEGQRAHGDEYLPRGKYLDAYTGQLARWDKQGPDLHHRVYPGAPLPIRKLHKRDPQSTLSPPRGGRGALLELLMARERTLYSSKDIEELTGIRATDLARNFKAPSVQPIAEKYGWTLRRAKDLGLPGRANHLVHSSYVRSAPRKKDRVSAYLEPAKKSPKLPPVAAHMAFDYRP